MVIDFIFTIVAGVVFYAGYKVGRFVERKFTLRQPTKS